MAVDDNVCNVSESTVEVIVLAYDDAGDDSGRRVSDVRVSMVMEDVCSLAGDLPDAVLDDRVSSSGVTLADGEVLLIGTGGCDNALVDVVIDVLSDLLGMGSLVGRITVVDGAICVGLTGFALAVVGPGRSPVVRPPSENRSEASNTT